MLRRETSRHGLYRPFRKPDTAPGRFPIIGSLSLHTQGIPLPFRPSRNLGLCWNARRADVFIPYTRKEI
jgi:hypothetical protein